MSERRIDIAQFGRLVEGHYAAVSAVAFAITRDLTLAEDVAQETFVAAWTSLDSLRDASRVRPWLCGIARNQAKNALRRRDREVRNEQETIDMKPSILDRAIDRETSRELATALAAIPASYREPLVLFYWEEHSIEQVASMLAISQAAAQKRISRARSYLEEGLAARFDETGRARKRASAAAAASVLAVIAARPTAAHAAPRTKGSTMLLGKALLLTAAGAAIIAGVAYSTGNHSDAGRPRDVTSMPSAVETPNAVTTPNAAAPSVPATPALPQRNGSGSHHMPGQPSPSSTFGAPAGYELTVVSPTDVAVELAGGKSSNFLWRDPPTPTFERHVRGRVVDEQGRGIAGAVVVISETMRVMFGSLTANEGALTSADGSFDVAVHRDTPERAIALHGRGWSAPIDVPGGKADAAGLVVTIGKPGTLELHARKNHAPLEAEIYVSQPGLELGLETDARGDFSLPRLAPGAYHVRAWPLQMFAGGTSKPMEKDVSVDAGKTTRVDFDLPTGTLLVVTASHAQELMTIEYFLAPGTEQLPLAELNKRARAGAIMDTLFGGQDLDQPMQFHDLAPGTYTLCIDQKATNRDHLPLVCRSIEIKGDKPVVELDVKLP